MSIIGTCSSFKTFEVQLSSSFMITFSTSGLLHYSGSVHFIRGFFGQYNQIFVVL